MPLRSRRASGAALLALLVGTLLLPSLPALADPGGSTSDVEPAGLAVTPGSGPVSVSIVMPITVAPTTAGLLTADELTRATGPFGALTRQLDAVAGSPVALAVDPMIIASIRVLGSSAPESAAQWLARLAAMSNETFLLSYADSDLVSAARTGTLGELAPTGFDFAMDADDFSPAATPAPTPTPTTTATAAPDTDVAPPYPSTAELLAWTTTLPAIAWPSTSLGADDLPALAAAGYTDVIVSSDTAGDPRAPLVDLGGIRGIVADDELSSLLGDAADAVAPAARAAAIDALDAALASASVASPGRGIVVTLDRDASGGRVGLSETLARLETSSSARMVTLAEILDTTPAQATLGAGSPTTDRDAAMSAAAAQSAAEQAFSTVLTDPAPLLDPRRLELIALASLEWDDDPVGWATALRASAERSTEIVTSVKLEKGSDVVLLARNAEFKVAVSNALPFPVTVRVSADPQGPILRSEKTVEVTVEPESTATALIPVEAVANGEVTVVTTIQSPTGVFVDSGQARVEVHAEWEGIGTLVIVIVLVLVFAAGIVRLVIVRRRARSAEPAETPEPSDPTETDD